MALRFSPARGSTSISLSAVDPALQQSIDDLSIGAVRADRSQSFTQTQKNQAITNLGIRDVIYVNEYAGFDPTGVTDSTAAVQAALNAVGDTGGVCQIPQAAKVLLNSANITIPANVVLRGGLTHPENPGSSNYADLGGIRLGSAYTISCGFNAGVENMLIYRAGMTFPATDATAFAGTALTFAGDGCVARAVLVLGFNKALAQSGVSCSRYHIDHFQHDCVNGLFLTLPSYDSSVIRDVRAWPFSTAAYSTEAALTRAGTAFYMTGSQDDTSIDNILAYGYDIGLHTYNTGGAPIGKVWIDYPAAYAAGSGSIGVKFGASTTNLKIDQLWCWSMNEGIVSEMAAGEYVQIGLAAFISTAGAAVSIGGGNFDFGSVRMQTNLGYCWNISSAASYVKVQSGQYTGNTGVGGVLNAMPVSALTDHIDINMVSDEAAGSFTHGANAIDYPTLASAATLQLPPNGDAFKISGTTVLDTIGGGYGGRVITLQFTSTSGVSNSGNVITANASNFTAIAGSVIVLAFDGAADKWRERSRSTHLTGGLMATNTVDFAQLRQGAALSVMGNGTNALANYADIQAGTAWDILRRDGSSALAFGPLTAVIDNIGSTRGSILYRGAAGWAALTPGTVAYPLVSAGAGADPAYGVLAVAGGGTGDTGTAWTAYTPTITCAGGAPTTVTLNSGRYKTIGKTLFFSATFKMDNIGTCAFGINVTLPNSYVSAAAQAFMAHNTTSGAGLQGFSGAAASTITITTMAGAFPAVNNDVIFVSGSLEIQ